MILAVVVTAQRYFKRASPAEPFVAVLEGGELFYGRCRGTSEYSACWPAT
jgi:hypothetical protein